MYIHLRSVVNAWNYNEAARSFEEWSRRFRVRRWWISSCRSVYFRGGEGACWFVSSSLLLFFNLYGIWRGFRCGVEHLAFVESGVGVSSWVRVVLLLRGGDGGPSSARTQGCLLVVLPGSPCGVCVCVLRGSPSSVVYGRVRCASDDSLRLLVRFTFKPMLLLFPFRKWLHFSLQVLKRSVWIVFISSRFVRRFCAAYTVRGSWCAQSSSVHGVAMLRDLESSRLGPYNRYQNHDTSISVACTPLSMRRPRAPSEMNCTGASDVWQWMETFPPYIHMSTRSDKGIGLLLVEPLHLEHVHPYEYQKRQGDRALTSRATAFGTQKVEVLILQVDENVMLRDEEGRTRNSTRQLINAEDDVIPDVIDVAETNNFDLNCEWFLASLDEVYMIPIQLLDDIMAKMDEQHVSGELSRVEEAGTKGRTSTSTDATTSTSTDITTSTSIDITTSTSIDVTTSSSIDDVDREVTMEDSLELEEWLEDMDQNSKKKLDDDQHTSRGDLETSKASIGRLQPDEIDRQPPHIIDLHPPDIDRHYQPLIDRHHPPNIDRCPLLNVPPGCIIEMEPIEERMYMFKASHLAVPKHQRPPFWTEEAAGFHKRVKRIHDPVKIVVPCAVFEAVSPIPPDRSMQFSSHIEGWRNLHAIRQVWGKEEGELEEEKEDQGQFSVFIDSSLLRWCQETQNREVTMEDSLKLKEWLEDMDQNSKKNLDVDKHTSRGNLGTSMASIDVPPGCIIEMEPIEERMYMSKASHFAVPKHQRPPIWTEKAAGFHKRVKRIHDPVKTVVPCVVLEAESPIPPDRSMQFSSHIEVLDDHQHVEASQRGLRFRDEVDKGPAEAASIDTDHIPSIDTYTSPSIDTTTASSIYSGRVSEQKDFDICGILRDEDTTTRSDKSGGKKRRNWKKRKRIKDSSQFSLIPRFSDGVRTPREPKVTSNTKLTQLIVLGLGIHGIRFFKQVWKGWRNLHAIRQVWGKEEGELEEEKEDQGQFSVFIDSSLLRWCQETQSAQ
ncbi:hypothetical protein DY000_02041264 [Brassica cretica]|uniref:Uncharacterized protein n=1 Tax=Brassica cretica TaxID=69181 RepID=A0ABQ7BMA5_BRACR|nr:hypothetical protein DY000_02041264 [Brassica cretica]